MIWSSKRWAGVAVRPAPRRLFSLRFIRSASCLCDSQLTPVQHRYKSVHSNFLSGRSLVRTWPLKADSRRKFQVHATGDTLAPLGHDVLTFLAATVLTIPLFKRAQVSPVLGFLFSGVVLNQLGLFRNVEEIERLGELGVLFLLFEQGLELTADRLKTLSKYAFGMGLLQMIVCTAAFTAFALPIGHGLGSVILEQTFHAPASLVAIRSIDEAIVIGYALSLSSSAFVLQVLAERGELATRFGSATLGLLLFQDIAVVPFLVLLPKLETTDAEPLNISMLLDIWPQAMSGIVALIILLVIGRVILRKVFQTVAAADSSETFVAACLLAVTGCSVVTQSMGFSDTLGAFLAGVLLAETNFRTQVEVDVKAVRGILLGLFFCTTGASIDLQLLHDQLPVVLGLVVGLIGVKSLLISLIGPIFGLSRAESVRTGLLMSQGGEFAFVLLSLANTLDVLPQELNKLLIIVVVISMALTPALAQVSETMSRMWEVPKSTQKIPPDEPPGNGLRSNAIVMCGFGQMGQIVANLLNSPLVLEDNSVVAFDLDYACVKAARSMGFPVFYADATKPEVVKSVGVDSPQAIIVLFSDTELATMTVSNYRRAFPETKIYAHATNLWHKAELQRAGASYVVSTTSDAAISLGVRVLQDKGGIAERDVNYLRSLVEEILTQRVTEMQEDQETRLMNQSQNSQSVLPSLHDTLQGCCKMVVDYPETRAELPQTSGDIEEANCRRKRIVCDADLPSQVNDGTSTESDKYETMGVACGEGNTESESIDLKITPVNRND